MYTLGSLFTGIGGIDLAFERAGFEIKWQVEIDDYCNAILDQHWFGVNRRRDVRDSGAANLSAVDVMAGGFPCQDISNAGRGAGIKEGTRSGLWFHFARIIGELRPRYVFIENVPAITSNGGETVLSSLAALGYDAEWGTVPASALGAPHKRERWFCVAYRNDTQPTPTHDQIQSGWNTANPSGSELAYPPASSKTRQSEVVGLQPPMVGAELGAGGGIVGGSTPQGIFIDDRVAASGKAYVAHASTKRSHTLGQWGSTAKTGNQINSRSEQCSKIVVYPTSGRTESVQQPGQGVGLADAFGPRLEVGQSLIDDRFQEQPSAERSSGNDLPNANGISADRASISRSECSDGTVESRLGGIFDGLPARLDAIRRQSRWPAPPGQPQYRWEKPRTSQGTPNRAARLKALGNAVVPQVVQPFAEGIREALEAEDRVRVR